MEKELIIKNDHGLHARPAALFVQTAAKFKSNVDIESHGKRVNGKSILSILSLGLNKNDLIKLIVSGPDDKTAFDQLEKILNGE